MAEEGPVGTTTDSTPTIEASGPPPEPFVIRLSDIVTQQTSALEKEEDDKAKLSSLINPDWNDIRAKLIAWAARKFALPCDFMTFSLNPPNPCSDGVYRTLPEYVQFLTGKTISEHLATFQSVLPDFVASYLIQDGVLHIGVVTR